MVTRSMFNARMVRGRFIDQTVTIKKAARGAIARVRVLHFAAPDLLTGAAADDRWLRVGSGVDRDRKNAALTPAPASPDRRHDGRHQHGRDLHGCLS